MRPVPIAAARCLCPAKINLSLIIRGQRPDGYHLIESEMLPIGIADTLHVRVSPGPGAIELEVSRLSIPPGRDNLVFKAAELFMARCNVRARVQLRLVKQIPTGAGLGGGSSDAATALRVLNHILGVGHPEEVLRSMALNLGADVPFFVTGRPALVTGIGEIQRPLTVWPDRSIVVAFYGAGLATAAVYARFDASLTSPRPVSSIPVFPHDLGPRLRNDLEQAASQLDPGVEKLKKDLLAQGACEVGMSGSGSAVFGFFSDDVVASACAERLSDSGVWAAATRILEAPPPIEWSEAGVNW